MQPRYCYSLTSLKTFLGQLGLTDKAISTMTKELNQHNSSSVRVTLTEDKIALITQELLVMRLKRSPGKFLVIAPDNTGETGLSPHLGQLTEEQARRLLNHKYKKPPSEIDQLMKRALLAPEV